MTKNWLANAKLKPLSLFIPLFLMLKKAFDNVQNREMKSESGFRVAMASQPFDPVLQQYAFQGRLVLV